MGWLVALAGGAAQAQTVVPPRATAGPLEGVWRGILPVPGGELELKVSVITLANGAYYAALDVPMQKVMRSAVTVRQPARTDSVIFTIPQTNSRFLARRSADGQQLQGLWCRPDLRTPVQLHRTPLPAVAKPAGQPTAPYREEEVAFSNFGARLRLAGTLTLPHGAGPFPAAVLVSDLGRQDRDGLVPDSTKQPDMMSYRLLGSLADYLTRHGVAVLRCDDRGVGKSAGANEAATPAQRAADVQAALNYLRTRPEIDLLRIGLVGHGEGANIALLAAAQPLPPAFVIGLGAYGLPGHEILLQQATLAWQAQKVSPAQLETNVRRQRTLYDLIRYSTNPAQTQAMVTNLLRQGEPTLSAAGGQQQAAALLTPWYRSFLTFDPLENLAAVQCPVLLITGLADEQAPAAQHLAALERELKAGGNRAVTAFRPVGVNHLLQPPPVQWTMLNGEMKPVFSPAVQEQMRQWLTTQIGK